MSRHVAQDGHSRLFPRASVHDRFEREWASAEHLSPLLARPQKMCGCRDPSVVSDDGHACKCLRRGAISSVPAQTPRDLVQFLPDSDVAFEVIDSNCSFHVKRPAVMSHLCGVLGCPEADLSLHAQRKDPSRKFEFAETEARHVPHCWPMLTYR